MSKTDGQVISPSLNTDKQRTPSDIISHVEQVLKFYIQDLQKAKTVRCDPEHNFFINLLNLFLPDSTRSDTQVAEVREMIVKIRSLHDERNIAEREIIENLHAEIHRLRKQLQISDSIDSIYPIKDSNSPIPFEIFQERFIQNYAEINDMEKTIEKLRTVIQIQQNQIEKIVEILAEKEKISFRETSLNENLNEKLKSTDVYERVETLPIIGTRHILNHPINHSDDNLFTTISRLPSIEIVSNSEVTTTSVLEENDNVTNIQENISNNGNPEHVCEVASSITNDKDETTSLTSHPHEPNTFIESVELSTQNQTICDIPLLNSDKSTSLTYEQNEQSVANSIDQNNIKKDVVSPDKVTTSIIKPIIPEISELSIPNNSPTNQFGNLPKSDPQLDAIFANGNVFKIDSSKNDTEHVLPKTSPVTITAWKPAVLRVESSDSLPFNPIKRKELIPQSPVKLNRMPSKEQKMCPICGKSYPANLEDDHNQECLFPKGMSEVFDDLRCPKCHCRYSKADEMSYLKHLTICYENDL